MAFVYMLRCSDGSYYVGSTRNLEQRLWEHQDGRGAEYTRRRLPVALVWHAEYPNIGEAFFWEKRIQGWSRAKRERLIHQDHSALPALARKQFRRDPGPQPPPGPQRRTVATLRSVVMPSEVVAITDAFLASVRSEAPSLVQGLYLHGSLCWGEFFEDSDIDFVGVLMRPPTESDLAALDRAHAVVRDRFARRRYEGFYCQPGDLAGPPSAVSPVPVHYEGSFSPAGRVDVNLVTWHELAERGQIVVGGAPSIHTDLPALLDFTRENLRSYWAPRVAAIAAAGLGNVGADDNEVVWATLGVARLHHLLARGQLTSKSGAGRYVLDALDRRWHRLAGEALALRERPGSPSAYDDPAARGRDLHDFLAWAVADGGALDPASLGLDTPSR